jgi:hypothetical protein
VTGRDTDHYTNATLRMHNSRFWPYMVCRMRISKNPDFFNYRRDFQPVLGADTYFSSLRFLTVHLRC